MHLALTRVLPFPPLHMYQSPPHPQTVTFGSPNHTSSPLSSLVSHSPSPPLFPLLPAPLNPSPNLHAICEHSECAPGQAGQSQLPEGVPHGLQGLRVVVQLTREHIGAVVLAGRGRERHYKLHTHSGRALGTGLCHTYMCLGVYILELASE